jgi:hypothetical protein
VREESVREKPPTDQTGFTGSAPGFTGIDEVIVTCEKSGTLRKLLVLEATTVLPML